MPVVGVVSAPAEPAGGGAGLGLGAYTSFGGSDPRRLAVSGVADLGSASLSFSSLSGWADRGIRDRFIDLTDAVWRVGLRDFYPTAWWPRARSTWRANRRSSSGILAPLDVLVREAGGTFTNLSGNPGRRRQRGW